MHDEGATLVTILRPCVVDAQGVFAVQLVHAQGLALDEPAIADDLDAAGAGEAAVRPLLGGEFCCALRVSQVLLLLSPWKPGRLRQAFRKVS